MMDVPGMEPWRADEYRVLARESVEMGEPAMAIQFQRLAAQIDQFHKEMAQTFGDRP